MKIVQAAIEKLNLWQQKHHLPAFLYAVLKKYGEDHAGKQAALLTYYSFLSLFPLLLILTTLAGIIAGSHPEVKTTVINSMTDYFPVLGSQLSEHVHTLHKSGLALLVGIVFLLYGARGVADAFQHGVSDIWKVPQGQRPGFPKSTFKSLALITVGGLGLLTASVAAGLAATAGHGLAFRGLSVFINVFILFWLFTFLLNMCLPEHVPLKDTRAGAASAAVGLVILQAVGGYLLARELKNLDALYSNFAIPLGLLFWLYLQAQVLYYAVEIASVKAERGWPRSITGRHRTPADRQLDPANP